jgi:hypothetical protein
MIGIAEICNYEMGEIWDDHEKFIWIYSPNISEEEEMQSPGKQKERCDDNIKICYRKIDCDVANVQGI